MPHRIIHRLFRSDQPSKPAKKYMAQSYHVQAAEPAPKQVTAPVTPATFTVPHIEVPVATVTRKATATTARLNTSALRGWF